MKAWLVQQDLFEAISKDRIDALALEDKRKVRNIMLKAHSALVLCLGDDVLRKVADQETAIGLWEKFEDILLKESLAMGLSLKKVLYNNTKKKSKGLKTHKKEFSKGMEGMEDMKRKEDEEDSTIKVLSPLPNTHEDNVETLVCGRETSSKEDWNSVLNSKEGQNLEDYSWVERKEELCLRGRRETKKSNDLEEAMPMKGKPMKSFTAYGEDHFEWRWEKQQD